MITFLDGPAKGQRLNLRRAPLFLRVTEAAGKWDGLDQLDDEPKPEETIHVYLLSGEPSFFMWDGRDENGRRTGGRGLLATYRHFSSKLSSDITRDTPSWRAWCQSQVGKAA